MIDLWVNVFLTIIVALAVVLVEWITSQMISDKKKLKDIDLRVDQLVSQGATSDVIAAEIKRLGTNKGDPPIWGSDLASIAFSLDLAILGIWISRPNMFPFFSRWDEPGISRQVPIWFIVLLIHFLILLLSIIFKRFHLDMPDVLLAQNQNNWKKFWVYRKRNMLYSNLLGSFCLFSTFVMITNSI